MGEVFLSYKAEDRARLKPLVAALEADGCHVWWDAHIGGGADWREEIQDHLDGAHCVIVAWSERSVGHDGRFVRDEATRALRRGAYLAISIDGVDPPLGFGELQAIPLNGWKGNRKDPRYQALLTAVRARLAGEAPPPIPVNLAAPRISRRAAIAAGGAGLVAVAGGGWVVFGGGKARAPKRIAVMPFANLSGDPAQAYFSDGIAEELRGALSRIGLEVIGRTSSDAVKDLDTKAAAAKLGVANILTGSVRRSPQTIRIGAQLIGGDDGIEHWAQTYDRAPGDTIKIQTDIAASVAEALSVALGQAGKAALTLGGTKDSLAQDLVLQSRQVGREAATLENARRRIALAERAIIRDPDYADAYVEKASALYNLAASFAQTPAEATAQIAQAEIAARNAAALAPRLGSAHTALANVALGRLDFSSCLRETKEAIALSPDDPDVLLYGARNLGRLESPAEALRLVDRSIALDPLNDRAHRFYPEMLLFLRRFSKVVEAGRKSLERAPKGLSVHLFVGDALLLLGQPNQAIAEYDALGPDSSFRLARLALVAARTGDRAGAERGMAQLYERDGALDSYQYAEIRAQLGDRDKAFAELDNAISVMDPGLAYLKVDPFLDPIRNDRRYVALLRKLNFP